MSASPRLFGLNGRSATLLSSSLTALFCSLWAGQGLLAWLVTKSANAAGLSNGASSFMDEDVGEHEQSHRELAFVLSFSHFCALATSACALVGFSGAYSKHLPWIRFYALYSVAESGLCALVLASIGILAVTTASRDLLSQTVCAELTAGVHRQSLWTNSMLEGLESCEESFQSIVLPLWVAASAMLLLKWQFVDCTLAWYHFLVKRQAVFGKPSSSTYDTIPLSAMGSPGKSPKYSRSDRPRARTMSTSLRHVPHLSLIPSPYSSQASSPMLSDASTASYPSDATYTTSPASYTSQAPSQNQQALQRRQAHAAQPSHHEHLSMGPTSFRQKYLVYAPVALLPLEEAREWAVPGLPDAPPPPKRARAATAFAAIKGHRDGFQDAAAAAAISQREAEGKIA